MENQDHNIKELQNVKSNSAGRLYWETDTFFAREEIQSQLDDFDEIEIVEENVISSEVSD